jgi:hypothetical protein
VGPALDSKVLSKVFELKEEVPKFHQLSKLGSESILVLLRVKYLAPIVNSGYLLFTYAMHNYGHKVDTHDDVIGRTKHAACWLEWSKSIYSNPSIFSVL